MREIVAWIDVAQDRDMGPGFVNTLMNILAP